MKLLACNSENVYLEYDKHDKEYEGLIRLVKLQRDLTYCDNFFGCDSLKAYILDTNFGNLFFTRYRKVFNKYSFNWPYNFSRYLQRAFSINYHNYNNTDLKIDVYTSEISNRFIKKERSLKILISIDYANNQIIVRNTDYLAELIIKFLCDMNEQIHSVCNKVVFNLNNVGTIKQVYHPQKIYELNEYIKKHYDDYIDGYYDK